MEDFFYYEHGIKMYRYNKFHEKSLPEALSYLREHELLAGLEIDFNLPSLTLIQRRLQEIYFSERRNELVDLNPKFDFSIVIIVGESYIRQFGGIWVSTEEKELIPFGIEKNQKLATRFATMTYDVLNEYPWEWEWQPESAEGLYDFRPLYDQLCIDLPT